MKALGCATVLVSLLAVGSQAEASPPWKRERYVPLRYDHGGYDYARVVDVDPIIRRVRVETPRRECWEEVREVRASHYGDQHSAGPMILGGIIGGVVGNQIGSGRGKDIATVAGTLIGASVGHDVAVKRARGYSPVREEVVERCATRYEHEYEERIEGYDVTYLYEGKKYHTRLPYDPGDRIRVHVDVSPAE
jgi:uncharacterized protein YcfJ